MTREEQIYKLKNGSETAIWAALEIERLEKELAEYKDPKNWTRPYNYRGILINEHALYKPKLTTL